MRELAISIYHFLDNIFFVSCGYLTIKITSIVIDSGFESVLKDTQNILSVITILIGIAWGLFRLYRDYEMHQLNKKVRAAETRKIDLENEREEIENNKKNLGNYLFGNQIKEISETDDFKESEKRMK